jgi:hypothetical protein
MFPISSTKSPRGFQAFKSPTFLNNLCVSLSNILTQLPPVQSSVTYISFNKIKQIFKNKH